MELYRLPADAAMQRDPVDSGWVRAVRTGPMTVAEVLERGRAEMEAEDEAERRRADPVLRARAHRPPGPANAVPPATRAWYPRPADEPPPAAAGADHYAGNTGDEPQYPGPSREIPDTRGGPLLRCGHRQRRASSMTSAASAGGRPRSACTTSEGPKMNANPPDRPRAGGPDLPPRERARPRRPGPATRPRGSP